MTYDYEFEVWPDEKWGFPDAIFTLFRSLQGRIEMEFTQEKFEWFRSQLNHQGLSLRQVTRTPHSTPELVH